MKITVIIPSYRPGHYIFDCLDSLYNQTIDKDLYEIIIVLNGCDQPYRKDIQNYINGHSEMMTSLIQTDTPGVSNARNIGIAQAKGQYLTFIDDDDLVSASFLFALLKVSSKDCVGCANSYAFRDNIEEKIINFIGNGYQKCINKPFTLYRYRAFLSPPYAKLIHWSLIDKYRFPIDMKKSEDSVFCLQISPNIKEMKLASPDAIYYQRLRPGSAMRKKESIWSIVRQHIFIEYKYLCVWIKNPFRYNFKFFLSRIVACGRNCIAYIKLQEK